MSDGDSLANFSDGEPPRYRRLNSGERGVRKLSRYKRGNGNNEAVGGKEEPRQRKQSGTERRGISSKGPTERIVLTALFPRPPLPARIRQPIFVLSVPSCSARSLERSVQPRVGCDCLIIRRGRSAPPLSTFLGTRAFPAFFPLTLPRSSGYLLPNGI